MFLRAILHSLYVSSQSPRLSVWDVDLLRSRGLGDCTTLAKDNVSVTFLRRGAMLVQCTTAQGTFRKRSDLAGQNVPQVEGTIDTVAWLSDFEST